MKVLEWLSSCFSKGDKATMLYKRGMAKAKKHDHQGAIEAYSSALEVPEKPSELKAMILYNRGLVYVASGMAQQGTEDLNAVLAMDDAAVNVKTAAQRKLARIDSRAGKRSA